MTRNLKNFANFFGKLNKAYINKDPFRKAQAGSHKLSNEARSDDGDRSIDVACPSVSDPHANQRKQANDDLTSRSPLHCQTRRPTDPAGSARDQHQPASPPGRSSEMDRSGKRAVPVPPAGAVPSAGQPRTHPTIVSIPGPRPPDRRRPLHVHAPPRCMLLPPALSPTPFDADPMPPRTAATPTLHARGHHHQLSIARRHI